MIYMLCNVRSVMLTLAHYLLKSDCLIDATDLFSDS